MSKHSDDAAETLRQFGLTYPGAHIKSPWPEHKDLAVNDKTFAYLSVAGNPFSISCKLPHSAEEVLLLPFTSPTGYGLGRHGWISFHLPEDASEARWAEVTEWIETSYILVAPKALSREVLARIEAADAD